MDYGKIIKMAVQTKVNSIVKCFRILESFTPQQPEISLTQLSNKLKMPKSTLLNMIRTLESAGYLYKINNSQNYHLGFKLMELSYNVRSSLPVVQYAIPFMEELLASTNETIYLTTPFKGRVLYLECVYPIKRAVLYSTFGRTQPMHCTGCGKAMLSYMGESEVDAIIAKWGLASRTPNTITDPLKLKKALLKYRELGYAIDNEEDSLNVRCIGMAIRSLNGDVAGALSISGSPLTMTDDKIIQYAGILSGACNFLSHHAHLFPPMRVQKAEN
jgi:DNA-binding IclR family transcriptional regulator